jgi:hypothetical protein
VKIKILAEVIHVFLDNRPSLFKEKAIKPIWARSLVIWEVKNDEVNLLFTEWQT